MNKLLVSIFFNLQINKEKINTTEKSKQKL